MESNIYNYEMIRAMMKSPKRDILPNDVLIYKNGEKAVLYEQYYWTILKFYDDELNHKFNDDDLLYVLFDIQDIIQDEEEQKLAYDRYIKPYIE